MLVPASILASSPATQALAQTSLTVTNGGVHNISLKAIQSTDGNIEVQDNFEILPEHVVSVQQFEDFTITPSSGVIDNVKVTDSQLKTTELQLNGNIVKPNLAVGSYLLDIIITANNGDKYAYETILVVLAPTQVFNETNKQQVINTFVKVLVDTKIIFNDVKDPEPSICYFSPSDPRCDPDENGKCPKGWAMNEDGQCHPGGKCPYGYGRVDDDETGTCYPERDIVKCDNGAIVLHEEDCAIYDPPVTPTPEPTPTPTPNPSLTEEPETPTPTPSPTEEPEPLDSICGGVPCTASEKEAGTGSDPGPGDSEPETEAEPESQEQDSTPSD